MKVVRFSGVRIDPTTTMFAPLFETVCQKAIQAGKEIIEESRSAPFFFGDHSLQKPTEYLIREMLFNGELFLLQKNDTTIGYACLRNIVTRRYCNLEVYMSPEYRKHIILGGFRDVLYKAAFAPWPEGLQLIKVKALPYIFNTTSIKALKRAGFVEIAQLFMEGLLNNQPCNMLLLELYPKEIQAVQGEVITNAPSTLTSAPDPIRRRDVRKQHSSRARKKPAPVSEHLQQPPLQSDVARVPGLDGQLC